MKWIAHIAKPVYPTKCGECGNELNGRNKCDLCGETSKPTFHCESYSFNLPNTTKADMRYAITQTSKKFHVREEYILCVPA